MHDNEVQLSGQLVERDALRHTPAGIPILAFTLKHESTQIEEGVPRQVALELDGLAVGEVARRMEALARGRKIQLQGFLTNRSRHSRRLVLHVNRFELV